MYHPNATIDVQRSVKRTARKVRDPGFLACSSRTATLPLAILSVPFMLVPADFVNLHSPIARFLYYAAAVSLCWVLVDSLLDLQGGTSKAIWITTSLSLLPFITAGTNSPLSGLYVALPVALGISFAQLVTPRLLALSIILATTVLVAEKLIGQHWYSEMFGTSRFVSYAEAGFRARGIVGQPVPSAFFAVAVGLFLVMYFLHTRKFLVCTLVTAMWLASLYATGTRSALLITLAVALPLVLYNVPRSRLIVACVGAGAVGLIVGIAWFGTAGDSSQSRLTNFEGIESSESGLVRIRAIDTLNTFPDDCGVSCKVFGHGARGLQSELTKNPVQFGLSTVDNQFVSLYWDFGLVGVGSFFGIFVVAIVRFFSGNRDSSRTLGAALVISLTCAALFFDLLYVRSMAIVYGVGVGLLINGSRSIDEELGRAQVAEYS